MLLAGMEQIGLSHSKFAWLMVQPAYWFNLSLDKLGTINQESLYIDKQPYMILGG